MKRPIHFKETQKFTQWWLWLIILGPIISIALKIISSIIYVFGGYSSDDSENLSMSWISGRISLVQILFAIFYLLTILFFVLSKLKVVVSNNEIKIFHLLFFKKVISLSEVVDHRIINYNFLGYGIRKTKKYGTVYNVKGKEGVAFSLKNGKKYLIGSQKVEEFLKSVSKN